MDKESTLSSELSQERSRYLDKCKEEGGTAQGFRDYVQQLHKKEPLRFQKRLVELLAQATTRAWERPPRQTGPDLFSITPPDAIKEAIVPEILTTPKHGLLVTGEMLDDENAFRKVSSHYATVGDRFEDAVVKMRKAAQSSAAAEEDMKQADEARR